MMKLTKAQLIEKINLLEKEIVDCEHLASAVEVKDNEIVKLKEKNNLLEKEIANCEHLASAVEAKDNEIVKLKEKHNLQLAKKDEEINKIINDYQNRIDDKENSRQNEIDKVYSTCDKRVKDIEDKYKNHVQSLEGNLLLREKQLSKLINVFGNTLKNIQGGLDNAIELNEYFLNEVRADGN